MGVTNDQPSNNLREALDNTTKALEDVTHELGKLRRANTVNRIFGGLLVAFFVCFAIVAYVAFINAQDDREALRELGCASAEAAARNGRNANEAVVRTFINVLVDPNDPDDLLVIGEIREELERQQSELIPLPICES
jgi:hypothetical protein